MIKWIMKHIFLMILVMIFVVSIGIATITGNLGVARVAGQVVTISLIGRIIWGLLRKSKKRGGQADARRPE